MNRRNFINLEWRTKYLNLIKQFQYSSPFSVRKVGILFEKVYTFKEIFDPEKFF